MTLGFATAAETGVTHALVGDYAGLGYTACGMTLDWENNQPWVGSWLRRPFATRTGRDPDCMACIAHAARYAS